MQFRESDLSALVTDKHANEHTVSVVPNEYVISNKQDVETDGKNNSYYKEIPVHL